MSRGSLALTACAMREPAPVDAGADALGADSGGTALSGETALDSTGAGALAGAAAATGGSELA
jgi:hypothetical protein